MGCTWNKLALEWIRTWIASTHSLPVMARIELRWLELDAPSAWPALEELLAIIYFERRRDIAHFKESHVTADAAWRFRSALGVHPGVK